MNLNKVSVIYQHRSNTVVKVNKYNRQASTNRGKTLRICLRARICKTFRFKRKLATVLIAKCIKSREEATIKYMH